MDRTTGEATEELSLNSWKQARDRYMSRKEEEKPRHYCGLHLDEWRELVNRSYKDNNKKALKDKLKEVHGSEAELTAALYDDFSEHFGYPEKLDSKTMDDTGAVRLCGAIIKGAANCIIDAEVVRLTGGYNLAGVMLTPRMIAAVTESANRCKRELAMPMMEVYTQGMGGSAIIKECTVTAREELDKKFRIKRVKVAAMIKDSRLPVEAFTDELRINKDELALWIKYPFKPRYEAIKAVITRKGGNNNG